MRHLVPIFLAALTASAGMVGSSYQRDPIRSIPGLVAWWDFTHLTNAAAASVPYVPAKVGWRSLVSTNGAPPTKGGIGLSFNGTTQSLRIQDNHWQTPTGVVPTGLCADNRDNRVLVGDFASGNVAVCTRDGQLLETISTGLGTNTLQGVALRPDTRSIALVATASSNVVVVNWSGSTLVSSNMTGRYKPNGIAWDEGRSCYWVVSDTDTTLRMLDANLVELGTVSIATVNADGISIRSDGDAEVTQDGPGFGTSGIIRLDPITGSTVSSNAIDCDNIEHRALFNDGTSLLAVDDSFHASGTRVDHVLRLRSDYSIDSMAADQSSLSIVVVLKPSATITTTRYAVFLSANTAANVAIAGWLGGLTSGKGSAFGRRNGADSSANATGTTTIGTSSATIVAAVFDWANTDAFEYHNAVLDGSNTSFQTAGNTESLRSLFGSVGSGFGAAFFPGEIAHVLIVRGVLDATALAKIKTELHL